MPIMIYQHPDNPTNPIYINSDDLQVATSIMIGATMIKNGLAEWTKRGTLDAIASKSKFNTDYIATFKDDPAKLASFIYDEFIAIMQDEHTTKY